MDAREISGHPILLIDGECVLCNRATRFVIRRDPEGTFLFAALQSPRAQRLLAERGLPPPPPGTFVLIEGNAAFYRSDAALRVLGRMPFPWRLARVALVVPRWLRDLGYRTIARVRLAVFGRTELYGMLTAAERARFLVDENPPA